MMRKFALIASLFAGLFAFAQTSDPWTQAELLPTASLAAQLKAGQTPTIFSVAFPVLYRNRHLPHAIDAGPGSKPQGIEALKKGVAALPKDADIVIYCGCCPMVKCPNIRPAYRALKELGFTHVRVLDVPENMHTDWYSKNYPWEPGPAAQ